MKAGKLLLLCVLLISLGFACRSALFRSAFYPVVAVFKVHDLNFYVVPREFSVRKGPVLLLGTGSGHIYSLRVFKIKKFLASCRNQAICDRIGVLDGASRSLLEGIDADGSGELSGIQGTEIWRVEGLFRPIDFDSAEARIAVASRLSSGRYVGLFESKQFFGKTGRRKLVLFDVTNDGGALSDEEDKLK